jgi:hypothetical protein
MADPIKVVNTEIDLGTAANTVHGGSLIRVVNTSADTDVLITKRDAANNILGTITIGHHTTSYSMEHLIKAPTDTLEANIALLIKATPIGFF